MAKFNFLQNKHLPQWVNLGLFILVAILNLNIEFSVNDWKELADPVVRSVSKTNFERNMRRLSLMTQTMCALGKLNVCAQALAKGG